MSIPECYLESFYYDIFFLYSVRELKLFLLHSMSVGYLVSSSWSRSQCLVLVPSYGVNIKSYQSLVGYFYKVHTTITLAYLSGSTPLYIKGLWLPSCLYFPLIAYKVYVSNKGCRV